MENKKKMIKVILIIVALLLFIVFIWAMPRTSDEAINFLQEKYDREFKFCSYEYGDILSNIDYVHCTTENIDSEHESIIVAVREEDDNTIFEDNYFSYLIRPEYEAYIADMIQDEFNEVKVYWENQNDFLSNELTSESTLSDFFQIESTYIPGIKVYVKGDSKMAKTEYEKKMQNIRNKLLASGHSYCIYIWAVSPEVYDTMERYEQTSFWQFYVANREPDGETYYYMYRDFIKAEKE